MQGNFEVDINALAASFQFTVVILFKLKSFMTMLLTSNFDRFDLNPFEEKMLFRLHAVWSTRVLNIRSSTQIWPKNKSNLRVFPVLKLIQQEYSQY